MNLASGNIGQKSGAGGSSAAPRAFTLIELILVMALLVIVIAVCAPTLSGFFHGRKLDSEARRMLSLIRFGQSRAVSEGIPMKLWVDAKQGTYGLQAVETYVDSDPKAVQYSVDQELTVTVGDPLPVTNPHNFISKATTRIPAIDFHPDGSFGETSPERLTLNQGDHGTAVIALSRNGLNYEIQTNNVQGTR